MLEQGHGVRGAVGIGRFDRHVADRGVAAGDQQAHPVGGQYVAVNLELAVLRASRASAW
jgi:hypothetical protein